ncbi:MAG: hypothetical protein ACKVS6_09245 [Planctomycetota bacterium]
MFQFNNVLKSATFFAGCLLLVSITAMGCSKKEETPGTLNPGGELNKMGATPAQQMANDLKVQQAELTRKIEEVKKKAEVASAETKAAVLAMVPAMEKARDVLINKIQKIATETGGNVQEMVKGVKISIDDLEKKIAEALAKLK